MRIAYIAYQDCSDESGVLKKIVAQSAAWVRAGHAARVFAAAPTARTHASLAEIDHAVFERAGFMGRFKQASALAEAVRAWESDLVYLRFGTYEPALARLIAEVPAVVELNTDDRVEYRQRLSLPKYLYHRAFRDRILGRAAALLSVSAEIGAQFGPAVTVIGNGIALDRHPVLPAPRNATPRAVFMGAPRLGWHGVDKIVELARTLTEWAFDVIGYSPADVPGPIPANVYCHGYLNRERYQPILAGADVALGTLALHRKGMDEASPLKVREYLAFGLPSVIAYRDTDFPAPVPFLLQLPNAEDSVRRHAAALDRFGRAWMGRRVERGQIAHLDVAVKERARIALFETVLARRRGEGRARGA